jgi:hypothetical protein
VPGGRDASLRSAGHGAGPRPHRRAGPPRPPANQPGRGGAPVPKAGRAEAAAAGPPRWQALGAAPHPGLPRAVTGPGSRSSAPGRRARKPMTTCAAPRVGGANPPPAGRPGEALRGARLRPATSGFQSAPGRMARGNLVVVAGTATLDTSRQVEKCCNNLPGYHNKWAATLAAAVRRVVPRRIVRDLTDRLAGGAPPADFVCTAAPPQVPSGHPLPSRPPSRPRAAL